jgi:type I restriction enzyme S subunit
MSSELRRLWEHAGGQLPDEWKIVPLESLLSDSKSIAVGVMYPGPDTPGGIPLIKVGDIKDGTVPVKPSYCISDKTNQEHKRTQLIGDELLITLVGNPGECVVVKPNMAGWNPARAIATIRLQDPNMRIYLKTVLESIASKHLIDAVLNTTVQKTLNLKDIRKLPIPLPPEQIIINISEIADILTNRIALLRETNATLEAIAQALFKSWFVDFDPVRAKQEGRQPEGMDAETAALFPDSFEEAELGPMPTGWEVKTIADVCDFQNGYAFKSNDMTKSTADTFKIFKMGNIQKGGGLNRSGTKDYYEKEKSKHLNRYLIKKGDLLMCMTDMKNNVALLGHTALMDVDDQFLLNQRVGMLRSKDVEIANFPFLYILTNCDFFIEDLRNRANSGVQVNLSTTEIKNTKFILPAKKVHQSFDQIVGVIQEKIFSQEQLQDSLSEIRDTLLPRLISGQLRLPEAEAQLERETGGF